VATKYVRADGSATWANANGPASSASDCCTISTAESNAAADDLVYLTGLGGIFRDTLNPGASGTDGHPVIYRGIDSAEIRASDIITGWGSPSGSRYQVALTTEPMQLWYDGTYGDRKTDVGDLAEEGDWYWASNVLYFYGDGGDPDASYTAIEVGQRDNCIRLSSGRDWITIDNITCASGNGRSLHCTSPEGLVITNCTVEWSWFDGIFIDGNGWYGNITVQDCVLRYNGTCGFSATSWDDEDVYGDILVSRCDVYENGTYQGYWGGTHGWTGGVKFYCSDGRVRDSGYAGQGHNLVVEYCHVHDNGPVELNGGRGIGIWYDSVMNYTAYPNIARFNLIHDNGSNGILVEVSDNTILDSNIIYNCGNQGTDWFRRGPIRVVARPVCDPCATARNNLLYGNICVGGVVGLSLMVTQTSGTTTEISDNIVKNNIFVGASYANMQILNGGDNDGVWGSGNVYQYNCLGDEETEVALVYWDDTLHTTYAAWEADGGVVLDSGSTHSVEADPGFADPDNDDYTIGSGSACIGTAVNLGDLYDIGLLPASTWPDGVLTADRDSY